MSAGAAQLLEVTGGLNPNGERFYVKTYRVTCTSVNDGPIVATGASGLSRYGDQYSYGNESDSGALLADIGARLENRRDHRRVWIITERYQTVIDQTAGSSLDVSGGNIDHPLQRPVEWSGSYAQFQEETVRNWDNTPIANTAGVLMPGLVRDDSRPELVAVKNLPNLNLSLWAQYRDKINSDSIWGLKPRQCKVQSITFNTARWGNYRYFRVRYAFQIKFEGWDESIENVGYMAHPSTSSDELVHITDDEGHPISEPAYLDRDGLKMTTVEIKAGFFNSLAIQVRRYKPMPFSALGLPARIKA